MLDIIIQVLMLVVSYLLGSIPNALIVGKLFKNIDIRNYGSKNLGATNSTRVLGFFAGFIVFFLDFLKGALVLALMKYEVIKLADDSFKIPVMFYGVFAFIGHLFPIFARFKGGKGVSTASGALCAYNPLFFFAGVAGYLLLVLITQYISLGSIASVVFCVAVSIIWSISKDTYDIWLFIVEGILALIIILKHIPNYKRIANNTESKLNFKAFFDKSQPRFIVPGEVNNQENQETK